MTTENRIQVMFSRKGTNALTSPAERQMTPPLIRGIGVLFALLVVAFFCLSPKPALAQANCEGGACVTSGPTLVNVDSRQGALTNALLSDLVGVDLNLSVADTNALAQGTVALSDLLEELRVDLGVATPTDVLTTTVTLAQLTAALAQVSTDAATIGVLNELNTLPLPPTTFRLGDLLHLQGTPASLIDSDLNVLDLLTGSIQLFNYQNVATTPAPVTLSGSALGLEGVLNSVTLRAQVVEPPSYVCGKAGAQFYAAATRLALELDLVDLNLDTQALETLLQAQLGGLVTVDANAALGQLDLYVVVGRGAGTLTQINAVSQAVTVQALPGVADLYLGTIADTLFFSRTHVIAPASDLDFAPLGTLSVTVTTLGVPVTTGAALEAKSFATGDNLTATTLTFIPPYPKTQTAITSASFVADLITELTTNLELQLTGSLGGSLDPLINSTILPALRPLVTTALSNPLSTVLTSVVDPLLASVGIELGGMDVTVLGVVQICDTDNDGVVDAVDSDDDGDGIRDVDEGSGLINSDNDSTPDAFDADSDNDGIPDATEGHDVDHNGQPDRAPAGADVDHDGLDDAYDPDQGGTLAPRPDTDGDTHPDFQDADDDGDTVNTRNEDPNGNGNPADDDSDQDGRPDYLDPANTNPCIPNANAAACTSDTDNDGTPNSTDPAPTNACVPNANAPACPTGDTDNDGIPNGTDPAPTNACVPNANALACPTGDTDNDGTPNGTDPAPTNACIPNANTTACQNDTDGDGTPNPNDPAPTNPCVPNPNAVACATGDADNDGTPNGTDPEPLNACIPNANAVTCATGDADEDDTPNGTDADPLNPCLPDPSAAMCDPTAQTGRISYLPLIAQQPIQFLPGSPAPARE